MPLQLRLKESLAVGDALRLASRFQTSTAPGVLRALHDEGAGVGIEGIGVDLEEAVRIAPKDEREGVEWQITPKPHVLRRMDDQLRLEELRVRPSNQAVDPV